MNLSFNDAELEVLRLAAGREGMASAAWAGRQVMAVAQHTLVPVSRDAGDVLRELIAARVHLRETVTALRALAAPGSPTADLPATAADPPATGLPATAADPPATGLPATAADPPATGLPATAAEVVARALDAVARVDEATVAVMRERRSRS
ncbi:hypothetical protein ACFCZQ_35930 [Streptomyces virginiae]|uniref:hypothetical protein n=1 Tax=Streptomyces virginiae TaxID=1961 RepID=UPI0035DE66D8